MSGLVGFATAMARINQLFAATPASAAVATRTIDDRGLGTDAEQLARRGARGVTAPPLTVARTMTPEERRRLAAEAEAERRIKAAGEQAENEADTATHTIRQVTMGMTTSFAAHVGGSVDAAEENLDRLGAETTDAFGSAGDAFVDEVSGAGRYVSNVANRAAELLNALLNSVSGSSETFDERIKGGGQSANWKNFGDNGNDPFGIFQGPGSANNGVGMQWGATGGAIGNDYAVTLIREWVGRLQYNQKSAMSGDANVIRNQTLNDIGMARLSGYWDRMFSRFGRLQDVAMEYMRRMEREQKRNRRTPTVRTLSYTNPSTGLLG
jgi:hypothetical protein